MDWPPACCAIEVFICRVISSVCPWSSFNLPETCWLKEAVTLNNRRKRNARKLLIKEIEHIIIKFDDSSSQSLQKGENNCYSLSLLPSQIHLNFIILILIYN